MSQSMDSGEVAERRDDMQLRCWTGSGRISIPGQFSDLQDDKFYKSYNSPCKLDFVIRHKQQRRQLFTSNRVSSRCLDGKMNIWVPLCLGSSIAKCHLKPPVNELVLQIQFCTSLRCTWSWLVIYLCVVLWCPSHYSTGWLKVLKHCEALTTLYSCHEKRWNTHLQI